MMLAILRIGLAGVFVWSGVSKLLDPVFFAIAIDAFDLGLSHGLVRAATFVLPWLELVAAVALLVGLWSRAAALVLVALLAGFSAAIVSLRVRGLDVTCPCFGTFELICTGPLGVCHLVRNAVLLVAAGAVLRGGGGRFALERRDAPSPGAA